MSQGFTRRPAQSIVRKNSGGSDIGPRRRLNLIEGTNVTLTITDDGANDEIDITVASTGGASSPLTTKGDVWGYDTGDARIPVGANDTVLKADSTQALGVIWEAVAHSETTGQTVNDHHNEDHQARHQSGGADALTGNLDATARVSVSKNSAADVGARRTLNFIEGTNVTLTITDDAAGEEVDITIAASGGGGSPLTTKGDLFGFTTVDARIPVGMNGSLLQADSVEAAGVGWDFTLTGAYIFDGTETRGNKRWVFGLEETPEQLAIDYNTVDDGVYIEIGNALDAFTKRMEWLSSDAGNAHDIRFFDGDGTTISLLWDDSADQWVFSKALNANNQNIIGAATIDADRFQISGDADTYIDQTSGADTISIWAGGVELLRAVEGVNDYVQMIHQIRAPDGTVGTPTYSFTDDPNTGITKVAATSGEFGFVGDGTERMRWRLQTGGGGLRSDQGGVYAPLHEAATLTDVTGGSAQASFTQWGTEEINLAWPSSTAVRVMAWGNGGINYNTGGGRKEARVQISFDGGSTWGGTAGVDEVYIDSGDPRAGVTPVCYRAGTPTGNIQVRMEYLSPNGGYDLVNGVIFCTVLGDL